MTERMTPSEVVDYPSSDGKPMAENDINREDLTDAVKELAWWFRDRPDVYVSGDLLIFFIEGDRNQHRAPDVFVTFGVEKKMRDNYKLWEEGPPTVIIEISSFSTIKEDTGPKKALYEQWGVSEYYLFDPKGMLLKPPLKGYKLVDGTYVPLLGPPFHSPALDLIIFGDGDRLRFKDPVTGTILPTYEEIAHRLESAESRAETAESRVEDAELRAAAAQARAAALEEELRRLRDGRDK